jgi:hypothetical protein
MSITMQRGDNPNNSRIRKPRERDLRKFVIYSEVEHEGGGLYSVVVTAEPADPISTAPALESIEGTANMKEDALRLVVKLGALLATAIKERGDSVAGFKVKYSTVVSDVEKVAPVDN